jgi:hypothetical protein
MQPTLIYFCSTAKLTAVMERNMVAPESTSWTICVFPVRAWYNIIPAVNTTVTSRFIRIILVIVELNSAYASADEPDAATVQKDPNIDTRPTANNAYMSQIGIILHTPRFLFSEPAAKYL